MRLPGWFFSKFLDVEAWKYLALLGMIFAAALLRHLFELVLRRRMRALSADSGPSNASLLRIDRALGVVAMALVMLVAVPLLELPPATGRVLLVAGRALLALGGVWLAFRVLDLTFDYLAARAALTASRLDDQMVPILRRTTKVFTLVVGTLFTLQNLDVNIGSLLAGLGLGGLAFALAAKDTVANFFGSLVIFIDKPFTIGDRIKLEEFEGVVEEVGLRTTRVRTFQHSLLTVPNARLTTAVIDNLGARRYRRYTTTLGITYDTPAEKVQAFCEGVRAIFDASPRTRKDFFLAEFTGFADFSLSIRVYCFLETSSWAGEMEGRTEINLEILRLADRLGVRFAFPTTSVHVESLAASGAPVAAPAPEADRLAAIVRGFAAGGELARPGGVAITGGLRPGGAGKTVGLDEGES